MQTMSAHLSHSEKRSHVRPGQHPWTVIHACEFARDVMALMEGQLAAGMRPSLLTPAGLVGTRISLKPPMRESARPVSLLHTWSHVRAWRSLMNESATESSSEILHAHSFSA